VPMALTEEEIERERKKVTHTHESPLDTRYTTMLSLALRPPITTAQFFFFLRTAPISYRHFFIGFLTDIAHIRTRF